MKFHCPAGIRAAIAAVKIKYTNHSTIVSYMIMDQTLDLLELPLQNLGFL